MAYFPENLDKWRKIALLIDDSHRIFISSHVNLDGDAIGSEIALAEFLLRIKKSVRIINHSVTPDVFRFLDTRGMIEYYKDIDSDTIRPDENDMVIFLDIGRYKRAGKNAGFLVYSPAKKVIIDHHPPESENADILVVNTRASSTGSLIYDLICHIDSSCINKDIAQAILTAIVTDTGYFRYSNTTATTHRIASSLFKYGVTAYTIRKQLEKGFPLCRQKLLGLMLSTVRTGSNGKVAYAYITSLMFEEAGASREHTDGLIDLIRAIKDVRIAVLIIQEGKELYKVSFRSDNGTPVNNIASLLGGGGHPNAAGANITGTLDYVAARVLEVAESYIESD